MSGFVYKQVRSKYSIQFTLSLQSDDVKYVFKSMYNLVQNGLRNTFLMIICDIYLNKVCYFLIQTFLNISCSPYCLPVGLPGGNQTLTLFTFRGFPGLFLMSNSKLHFSIPVTFRYVTLLSQAQLIQKTCKNLSKNWLIGQ